MALPRGLSQVSKINGLQESGTASRPMESHGFLAGVSHSFIEAEHAFRSRRQTDPDPIVRDRLGISIENFELLREHPADDFLREQTRLNLIDLHQFFETRRSAQ